MTLNKIQNEIDLRIIDRLPFEPNILIAVDPVDPPIVRENRQNDEFDVKQFDDLECKETEIIDLL